MSDAKSSPNQTSGSAPLGLPPRPIVLGASVDSNAEGAARVSVLGASPTGSNRSFGRSPLDRKRPPPLNLPPLPPIATIPSVAANSSSPPPVIVSTRETNNGAAVGGDRPATAKVTITSADLTTSANGGAKGGDPTSLQRKASFKAAATAGGVVVGVMEGQGAVLTAPIQDAQHPQRGTSLQHSMAAMEMRAFASALAMGSDADTRMGKRELAAVQQIADRLAADASRSEDKDVHGEHRPPLTVTSINDCFRLFFGSNVTIFPYYASRLGAVGLVVASAISCVINTNTMMCLHRARHNLVAIELHRRIDENILDANGVTPRGALASGGTTPRKKDDADDLNLFIQRAAARAKKEGDVSSNNFTASSPGPSDLNFAAQNKPSDGSFQQQQPLPFTSSDNLAAAGATMGSSSSALDAKEEQLMTLDDYAELQYQVSGGDVVPYFMSLSSMVKLSNALWPTHWLRHVMAVLVVISLFFGCCNFCLLMAKNMAPIIGLGQLQTVILCACMLAVMSMFMSPKTSTYLAACSNLFIFGGGALLLVASMGHERTEEEKEMSMQIFPKSVRDVIIFSPSVLMFLSAPLVTLEVETILAARIYPIIKSTFELHRGSITPPVTPTASGASTPRATSPRTSPRGGATSPPLSPTSNRNARSYNPSLVYVNIIQKYYFFSMWAGLACTVVILVIIAELILWSFKDNTNSVIALSLPESWIRTGILASLTIGLYACGALNFSPMCDILDTVDKQFTHLLAYAPFVRRAIGRCAFFSAVVSFLYLVPFFDLVAALSSTIRGSTLIFLAPPVFELQSEILRAAAKSQNKQFAATASTFARCMMGFNAMPVRSKVIFVSGMILGVLVLFVSTYFVIAEAISRQK